MDRPELRPHLLVGGAAFTQADRSQDRQGKGHRAGPAASARPWLKLPGPRAQDRPQGGSPGRADSRGKAFSLGGPGQRWGRQLALAGGSRPGSQTLTPAQGPVLGWGPPLRSPPGTGPTAEDVTAALFPAAQASQSFPGPAQLLEARRGRPRPCKGGELFQLQRKKTTPEGTGQSARSAITVLSSGLPSS